MKKFLEGSFAIAEAVRLSKPDVIAAYPITPQTHIVERLAEMVSNGEVKSEYVPVESEFSAITVCQGASARGVRTFSSTSSQGLALMHEALHATSGMRLPIVMAVANRALSAPINIWNDHSDAMSQRDTGWIQLFVENAQEALDMTLIGYRVGEDPSVSLPVMINMDGFILTHVVETLDVPDQALVDKFLPLFKPNITLDPGKPVSLNPIAFPDSYMDMKQDQQEVTLGSYDVITKADAEFAKIFKRSYSHVSAYNMEGADTAILAMGSVVGTLREFAKDDHVGVVKLRTYRPFPAEDIKRALKGVSRVVVLEKAASYGSYAPLYCEVATALCGTGIKVDSSIAGLGGRDITFAHIKRALEGEQWLS